MSIFSIVLYILNTLICDIYTKKTSKSTKIKAYKKNNNNTETWEKKKKIINYWNHCYMKKTPKKNLYITAFS